MIEVLLGEPATLEHVVTGDRRDTTEDYPKRLATGVGVDHRETGPVPGWGPCRCGRKVHGRNTTITVVTTVADVAGALAERTRPERAASWDPVGVQLGDPESTVKTVGVCHEVTEEILSLIVADPVDLLVTYHPLLFTPTNRLVAGRSAESRALRLIRADVCLLVTHTDFDAAPGGTADTLAHVFGLLDIQPFGCDEESGLADIGRVGERDTTVGALDAMASDVFGHTGLRVTGDRQRRIGRVAVVPGSGAGFVEPAAEVADALVTGDVPHHGTVLASDLGLAVIDPGHAATERPGMTALVDLVGQIIPVTHDLTDLDPTTWR